jgi:late competence protein required for DNA uptake (superfamily II DNA/RNA helicase)
MSLGQEPIYAVNAGEKYMTKLTNEQLQGIHGWCRTCKHNKAYSLSLTWITHICRQCLHIGRQGCMSDLGTSCQWEWNEKDLSPSILGTNVQENCGVPKK